MTPVSPSAQDTVTGSPSRILDVASPQPDDRRNAEFAGDDRRVAGSAAAVRDDSRGPLHDRFPVRVGHVGDDHVTRLHARHFPCSGHDAGRARADALADGAALRQRARALLQREAQYGSSCVRLCTVSGRACRT